MKNEDKTRFAKALWTLAVGLGTDFKESSLKVYCELLLAEYRIDELEAACMAFLHDRGRRFFPTVPEFHEMLHGNLAEKASNSIPVLENAMSAIGAYGSVAFKDPAIMVAIEQSGGWLACIEANKNLDEEAYGYWKHSFRKNYEAAAKSRSLPNRPYFTGMLERDNGPSREVALIENYSVTNVPPAQLTSSLELLLLSSGKRDGE